MLRVKSQEGRRGSRFGSKFLEKGGRELYPEHKKHK